MEAMTPIIGAAPRTRPRVRAFGSFTDRDRRMKSPVTFHPRHAGGATPALAGPRVELQLFTTLACNLRCTYCSEAVGDVRGSARDVTYSLEALDRFIRTHLAEREVYVTFYGGEPTLNLAFMQEVMRAYPHFGYQMQTNGTLLNRLPDEVCAHLANVLVSIDGGRETTDGFRGRGVYNRVMRNVARVRPRLGGKITARVTWGNADTTLAELDALLERFDYVYFQFAHHEGVYGAADMAKKKAVLAAMVARFFAHPKLYPMIPLMGIVRNKLAPPRTEGDGEPLAQCRVSANLLNVLPDGSVFPCPDMAWAPEMRQGSLQANRLAPSALQPDPRMPCADCEAYPWCRHNCMKNLHIAYVLGDRAYREGVVEPICDLVRFLGREIDRHDPARWLAHATPATRREIAQCEIYRYVEVMP